MELAPAPESLKAGDCVSQVAFKGPPVVEHTLGFAFGAVVAGVAASAMGAAVVAVGAAAVVVVAAAAVVVVVVVARGLFAFFFAAEGVDELHAAATSATAASPRIRVVTRDTGPCRPTRPAWWSRARRDAAPWCTGSPLPGDAGAGPAGLHPST